MNINTFFQADNKSLEEQKKLVLEEMFLHYFTNRLSLTARIVLANE